MNQTQTIECPKCHHQFNIEDVIQNRMEDEVVQRLAALKSELEEQAEQENGVGLQTCKRVPLKPLDYKYSVEAFGKLLS